MSTFMLPTVWMSTTVARGRCYDHRFLRFSAKKSAFFSKTNVMMNFSHKLTIFETKRQFFENF
jgi:hypothetical protein